MLVFVLVLKEFASFSFSLKFLIATATTTAAETTTTSSKDEEKRRKKTICSAQV